jgi:hypothetical protein
MNGGFPKAWLWIGNDDFKSNIQVPKSESVRVRGGKKSIENLMRVNRTMI